MVSQDIGRNKGVESTNIQKLKEEQMEKSHDEKLLEALIDRQQILEKENSNLNKYRALLRLFNKWDIFLTSFNKNTIFKTLFSKQSRIIAGCILCVVICFYLDFNLWSLIAVFLLLMMIYRLRIQEWTMRHYKRKREKLQSAVHLFSKLKKLRKENRLQTEIEETDKKIKSKNQEIEELNRKVMSEAENFTIDKIKKGKEVALSHPAVTISTITLLATFLGFFGKLALYYFTIGKFDYWGINRENISFFGNGLDGYINWGIMIAILLILFPLLNKWRYKDSCKNEIVIERKSFFLLYVPVCLYIIGFIGLPYILKASYEEDNSFVISLIIGILTLFLILCIKANNAKSFKEMKEMFGMFFVGTFILSAVCSVLSKLVYEKNSQWIKVFMGLCVVLIVLYFVLSLLMVSLYEFFSGLVNMTIRDKNRLILFSKSNLRININDKLFAALVVVAVSLYCSYFLPTPLSRNEFAILEFQDKVGNYVVLLENNDRYYISDFEITDKDESIRIFNGNYRIVSKEGIQIQNGKFKRFEKTNKSRDEYMEMQNQIGEFYSYIFSRGNPKLEKIFPKLQKSTNNE